jgi:hypothetical protein
MPCPLALLGTAPPIVSIRAEGASDADLAPGRRQSCHFRNAGILPALLILPECLPRTRCCSSRHRQFNSVRDHHRCRILDVQNAARFFTPRFGRGMNQKWPHRKHSAFRHETIDRRHFARNRPNLFVGQHPSPLSSWKHAKRSIRRLGIVEVHAQSNYPHERPAGA